MSAEEIINAWKNEQPEKKPAGSKKSAKRKPAEAPANPIGGQEISDEELELVEGGLIPACTQSVGASCDSANNPTACPD